MLEVSGGMPDKSVTLSLNQIMKRTALSCPTVIESLVRLEELGLVVSTTRQRGKVKTYYVSEGFEQVTAGCPVPVVMAGGKKLPEREALDMAFGPAILEDDVLAFDVAQLSQPLGEHCRDV